MSDKPASATSDLQARAFDPARRRVVPEDMTGRDWLIDGRILARLVVLCLNYCMEILIMIIWSPLSL